jgi:hypothetical protein
MPKFRDRVCICCGDVEYNTATRSDTCIKCYAKNKRANQVLKELEFVSSLGYTDVEGPFLNKFGQPTYTFKHPKCGQSQTWAFTNLLKQTKAGPEFTPCSHCGGKRRTKNGTAVSSENRKIKNPVGWIEYKDVVRRLTENTYAQFKAEINPLDLPRGMRSYHLDHVESIANCYEQGHPPEYVARKENLQMLPAFDNLSKGRK